MIYLLDQLAYASTGKMLINVIRNLGSSSAGKHVDIAEKVLGTNTQNVYVNLGMRCFENIMAIHLVFEQFSNDSRK